MSVAASVAVTTGLLAVIAWSMVMLRAILCRVLGIERRSLLMPTVALVTSIGFLAAGWGFAQSVGVVPWIDPDWLTAAASAGRGVLFGGGVLVLLGGRD